MSGVLLITCSTGGGHLSAQANVSKKLAEMGHVSIIDFDIGKHFYPVVDIVPQYWDLGIRNDLRIAHEFDRTQIFYEHLYEICYAKRLSKILSDLIQKHDISIIYDVQPTLTNLIMKIFSQNRPQGEYHKILTDLPYPGNRGYLGSLKRMKHHAHIDFFVHAPKTVPMPFTKDFWSEYAGLNAQHLKNTFAFPVHEFYFQQDLATKALPFTFPLTRFCENSLENTAQGYTIRPGTSVYILMLGSQGLNATFHYAQQFLAQAQENQQNTLFFVACAKNMKLYEDIFDYANEHNLPHAQVLPFPQITQDILACLMWQSDRYIIRPSGLSCLEQLALRQHEMNTHKPLWIHSGKTKAKPGQHQNEILLKGCYGHERANAQHMLASTPSHMVTPSTIQFFA